MSRVPANRYVAFSLLALGGLGWDLWSKYAVFRRLGHPGQTPWAWDWFGGWMTFRLYTTFNEGALWGLGQGWSWLFGALSLVAAAAILYWLFVRGAARSLWLTVTLGFIMAGTLGNLYDRLGWHGALDPGDGTVRYAVRDFLLFTFGDFHWPVFNFADVFLVTGAVMLVVHSLLLETRPATSAAAGQHAGADSAAAANEVAERRAAG